MDPKRQDTLNIIAEAQAACALPVKPHALEAVGEVDLKRMVHALAEKVLIERRHVAALMPAAETLLHHKREIGKQFIEFQSAVDGVKAQQKLVRAARRDAGIG
jgi:hypothetical protein